MSKYLPQYEDEGYFHNISDPSVNMLRAQWCVGFFGCESVLELGGGKFTLTEAFRKLGKTAWGMDWSMTACRYSPSCAVRATCEYLPFQDEKFDLITAFDVLEHLPKELVEPAIKEMWRVSKRWAIANIPLEDYPTVPSHLTVGPRPFWERFLKPYFKELNKGDVPQGFGEAICVFALEKI